MSERSVFITVTESTYPQSSGGGWSFPNEKNFDSLQQAIDYYYEKIQMPETTLCTVSVHGLPSNKTVQVDSKTGQIKSTMYSPSFGTLCEYIVSQDS